MTIKVLGLSLYEPLAANTDELDAWVGFKLNRPVQDGVARFVSWYLDYVGIEKVGV